MYQLFHMLSRQKIVLQQLPVFTLSFVIASMFYELGSFSLECLAFMATWFVLDAASQAAIWLFGRQRAGHSTGPSTASIEPSGSSRGSESA